jgi:hypothetical protein
MDILVVGRDIFLKLVIKKERNALKAIKPASLYNMHQPGYEKNLGLGGLGLSHFTIL